MSKNIIILIIAAVALLAVGGAVFYLGFSQDPRQLPQEQGSQGMRGETAPAATLPEGPKVPFSPPEEVPPKTTPQMDMSDWKTYRNEKYGFEIKYPPQLPYQVNTIADEYAEDIEFELPSPTTTTLGLGWLNVYVFSAEPIFPGKPCISGMGNVRRLLIWSQTNIGGVPFTRYEALGPVIRTDLKYGSLVDIAYEGESNNVCYHFVHYRTLSEGENIYDVSWVEISKYIMLFERIVSTFRLINSAP